MANSSNAIESNGSSEPTTLKSQSSEYVVSSDSQTASDFINSQLKLEADAREALPFTFDYCTKPLGALKQNVFSCLTCNPPPESPEAPYTPAGICYACSISCHGEHTLVELFARRNFVCDCGTTKLSDTSPCTLRINAATGRKGAVTAEEPVKGNVYNQNYRNRFCGCGEWYDPHQQKGTMFQCVGLATEEQGGCGEDWWHPECLLGLPRDWHDKKSAPKSADDVHKEEPAAETKENGEAINVDAGTKQEEAEDAEEHPVPPGFPDEDEFDNLVCYKCVTANPWIKKYANSEGFRSLEFQIKAQDELSGTASNVLAKSGVSPPPEVQDSGDSRKRKAEEDDAEHVADAAKKAKIDGDVEPKPLETPAHAKLPETPAGVVSIVSLDDKFRSRFCRCAECFPDLGKHPQLLEEEETYEPPLSDDGKGDPSVGTGSLLDRGEAALSNVDRVRAIEGVMAYNHLKEKVKGFLQPFAQSGEAVSAEDVKQYFAKLRGDEEAIKAAGGAALVGGDGPDADNRREQSGY